MKKAIKIQISRISRKPGINFSRDTQYIKMIIKKRNRLVKNEMKAC
jgi:hypothetical protein